MTSILRSIGFKKSKHTKLSEEWTDCQEPVKEGFTFYCRYLGSTPIEQSSNATMTSHAVKHILSMAKAKGKKLPNIALFISPTFISGTVMENSTAVTTDDGANNTPNANSGEGKDFKRQKQNGKKEKDKLNKRKKEKEFREPDTEMIKKDENYFQPSTPQKLAVVEPEEVSPTQLFKISIFRIPYCFAEATYDRIVSFVSTNPNGSHECHAIIANKRKFAQAIALTISQAFDIAFNRLNKNKSPGQMQSKEQMAALNSLNSAQKSMMVATNRLTTIFNEEENGRPDDNSNSFEKIEGKLATMETFPKLTIDTFTTNSRRRRRPSKEAESSEDEKKENNETNNNSDFKLLINFDDEANKNDQSNKQEVEKPLFNLDDLQELF